MARTVEAVRSGMIGNVTEVYCAIGGSRGMPAMPKEFPSSPQQFELGIMARARQKNVRTRQSTALTNGGFGGTMAPAKRETGDATFLTSHFGLYNSSTPIGLISM